MGESEPEVKAEEPVPAAMPAFEIPSWAGRPPQGLHLDVTKGEKLLQKLMIDDKRAYYFGRNPGQVDVVVDHASASRVHALLIFHKFLGRAFLVDLGSSHGTFIEGVRLEAKKPEQLIPGQTFRLGASTRAYSLRERIAGSKEGGGGFIGGAGSASSLPAREEELENLVEYNTALNRRMGTLPAEEPAGPPRKRKRLSVVFAEEEDVINPEDVDPSIGRFRNLVATTVIRKRGLAEDVQAPQPRRRPERRESRERERDEGPTPGLSTLSSASLNLGLSLPNPAPDLAAQDLYADIPTAASTALPLSRRSDKPPEPLHPHLQDDSAAKKKYAKEAWPGRQPPRHKAF